MEYTKEQLAADLDTMKTALQKDFEAKAKDAADVAAKSAAETLYAEKIKEVNAAIDELKAIKPEVTAAELKALKDQLDLDIRAVEKSLARVKGGTPLPTETQAKSLNERIAEAVEENHDNIQKFIKGENKKVNFELKAVGAVSTANVTGSTNWGAGNEGKFIMNPNNIGHIRTLLPVRPFGPATDYYFMRENGAGEGAIAPTAEGATKPQIDVDLVESSVKFEYVAGWLLTSRKAMMNIPGFVGFLQTRLPERLLDVEDAQILYGTGTTPQIKGILVSGNYVAGSAAGVTPLVEKIINDITLLEDTHKRTANGIVLRPAQFNSIFLNKSDGSGEYDLPPGVNIVNGQLTILGVPVAKTTALNATDYVVGDFKDGAELLVQEAMNIQFSYEDSTNFRSNQVTVRIEEAIALPVYGNNFFILGSSATS